MTREPLVVGQPFRPHRAFRKFSVLPDGIRRRPRSDISFGAKVTYSSLLKFIGANSMAWPSERALAEDVGCHSRQLRYYVAELQKLGLVKVTSRQKDGKANNYEVLWHVWLEGGRQELAREVGKNLPHLEESQRRESVEEGHLGRPLRGRPKPVAALPSDSEPSLRSDSEPSEPCAGTEFQARDAVGLGFRGSQDVPHGEDVGEAVGEPTPRRRTTRTVPARAMQARHNSEPPSLDEPSSTSSPTLPLAKDLSPAEKVKRLQEVERQKKEQTAQAVAKAQAQRRARAEKGQAERKAKEEKLANLAGRPEVPHLRQKLNGLESLWRHAMLKRWPDLELAKWGKKERGILKGLLERHTETSVAQLLAYVVDRWDSVRERLTKGRGTFPSVSFAAYHSSMLALEAQEWSRITAVKATYDAWVKEHPDELYPPEEVLQPYEACRKELKTYGLI